MKIGIGGTFKGMAPKIAPRLLASGVATHALNCRLLSGNVEPWFSVSKETPIPQGTAPNCFWKMSTGWLSWIDSELGDYTDSVDVVRGPIPRDLTERTYYTGLDAPRVTNLQLAFDGFDDHSTNRAIPPVASFLLGIPDPTTAPDLSVTSPNLGTNTVPLINPDADIGTTTGWTTESGNLVATTDMAPDSGVYCFGSSTVDTTAYQAVTLAASRLVVGQDYTLSFEQSVGSGHNSVAQIKLEFYNGANVLISALTQSSPLTAPVTANTWETRTLTGTVGPDVSYFKIYQIYHTTSGTVCDSFIDSITMTGSTTNLAFDGSSLDGWGYGVYGTGSVEGLDDGTSHGIAGPAFCFEAKNDGRAILYRDFNLEKTTSASIEFLWRSYSDDPGMDLYTLVGCDSLGNGPGLVMTIDDPRDTDDYIYLIDTEVWGSTNTIVETLFTGSIVNPLIKVHLDLTKVSDTDWSLNYTFTNMDTSTVILTDTRTVTFKGGWFGVTNVHRGSVRAHSAITSMTITADYPINTSGNNSLDEPEAVTYVYTYINYFNEEGPPSPASPILQKLPSSTVTVVTDTTGPDTEYGVKSKRIYRSVTGTSGTSFLFVAEIPLSQARYEDLIQDQFLGEELSTDNYDLPPPDSHSILALSNGITILASRNTVRPSVQDRPHAYPEDFGLSTDSLIVGLGAIDTTVVVVTEGFPYLVLGSTPESLSMQKLDVPQGGVCKRGIATILGYGVIYPSPDGLVGVSANGQVTLLTEAILSKEEWEEIGPDTLIADVYDGLYIGFSSVSGKSFVFDPRSLDFVWIDPTYDTV